MLLFQPICTLLLYWLRFLWDVNCFADVFLILWVISPYWFSLPFGSRVALLSFSHARRGFTVHSSILRQPSPHPCSHSLHLGDFFFHISCLNWDWIAPQLIYSLKDLSLFLTVFLRTPLLGWPFFSPLTCSATHMGRVCSCVLSSLPLTNESLSLCCTNPVIVRMTSYELWISGRANHPALFFSSKCLGPLNQLVKILLGLFLGLYWVYSLIWRELTSLWYCSISRIWCLYVINNIF